MEKETKHGSYSGNPPWYLVDVGVPEIRNFSKVAIGPRRDIPESPTIAQLKRIVNPTSKKSKTKKVADNHKANVIMCLAVV